MNIDSAVWAAPGSVTFDEEALFDFDFGGDVVEHSSGADTHVNESKVVNIRGIFTIGFNDRATVNSLLTKIDTEAQMTVRLKDMDAATGQEVIIAQSRLQRVRAGAQHNLPTQYAADFYARSTDGTTSPITAAAY